MVIRHSPFGSADQRTKQHPQGKGLHSSCRLPRSLSNGPCLSSKTSGRRWTSRPMLNALECCSAVLRYLLPSCGRRRGWFVLGCSFIGALSYYQYSTLLPRFHHRFHSGGGCGGHHPHHFPRLPQSDRHHSRSYPLHGWGPRGRGCHRVVVWLRPFPPAIRFGSVRERGQERRHEALTKARVGARLICPKAELLSLRAQTAPTERSSALNDDRHSGVRRAVAAATTATARSAENSTLAVVAMYWTLSVMTISSPGRYSCEATPAGTPEAGVALAAVDIAERATAWRALSTARDASRAAALAWSRASSSRRRRSSSWRLRSARR